MGANRHDPHGSERLLDRTVTALRAPNRRTAGTPEAIAGREGAYLGWSFVQIGDSAADKRTKGLCKTLFRQVVF